MYQTQIPFVKGLEEELARLDRQLDKVNALATGADVATVVTAFNALIADLKAKGLMKTK